MAIPLVILPPGELIYILIGSWFKESKYKSSATTILDKLSSISPLRIIILSFKSLEYISYTLSPSLLFSSTLGTITFITPLIFIIGVKKK